jgi:hypothetical protein
VRTRAKRRQCHEPWRGIGRRASRYCAGDHGRRSPRANHGELERRPALRHIGLVALHRREPLPRPDWSRALPRPLVIPDVTRLKTLADVRTLIGHLPADRRTRPMWRHANAELAKAAAGADPAEVSIAPRMVLMLEGVKCQPH